MFVLLFFLVGLSELTQCHPVSECFNGNCQVESSPEDFIIFDNKLFKCKNSVCNEVIDDQKSSCHNCQEDLHFAASNDCQFSGNCGVDSSNNNQINPDANIFDTLCDEHGNCRQVPRDFPSNNECFGENCHDEFFSASNPQISTSFQDQRQSNIEEPIAQNRKAKSFTDPQWTELNLDDLVILGAFSL